MTKGPILLGLLISGALAMAAPAAAEPGPVNPAAGYSLPLGVCDWTIGKTGDPAAFDLAAKLLLDGVQVSLVSKGDSLALADPALRRTFVQASRRARIPIASFAIGELNDVPLKSDPRAEKWLDKAIDVAAAMEVEVILVPFFGKGELRDDPAGVDAVVAALKRLAPKAEAKGVVLSLESYLSAADHLKILERVGSPAVKVYYDVGNSQDAGYPILDEIRQLGDRIVEVHAKDTKDLYGKGSMDFPSVLRALKDIGYKRWFVLEGTKAPLGVEESVRYDADYLRMIFGEIGTAVTGTAGQPASVVVLAGKDLPPPKLVKHVPPEYPFDALRSDIQGTVVVGAVIGLGGRVIGTKILKSVPALDAAAVEALGKWVYEPFLCDGKPQPYALTVTINFAKGEQRGTPKSEPPDLIERIDPGYPEDAIKKGIDGTVLLGIIIDDHGRVADASLLRSVPGLDQAAIDAVKGWQYAAAKYGGRPIPYSATVSMKFSLEASD